MAIGDTRNCSARGRANPVEHIVIGLGPIQISPIRHSMRGISTNGCSTGVAGWITRGLRSGNISSHAAMTSLRGISRHDA